jgi:hypothetical protein
MPTRYQDGTALTEDDHKQLLEQWSYLVRRIFEELARLYDRANLPNRWLYVIEPQEERFKQHGVFAPHIHAVMVNRWNPSKRNPHQDQGFQRSGYWDITTEQTDEIVERIFSTALGKPVDCRAACQVESIRGFKGLFFYLTKLGKVGRYLSKGSKMLKEMSEAGWEDYFPSNWYGSDRTTRKIVRDSVQHYDVGYCDLEQIREDLEAKSSEFEEKLGYPLFRNFYAIQPEDCDRPIVMTAQVSRITDISYAMRIVAELGSSLLVDENFSNYELDIDLQASYTAQIPY